MSFLRLKGREVRAVRGKAYMEEYPFGPSREMGMVRMWKVRKRRCGVKMKRQPETRTQTGPSE